MSKEILSLQSIYKFLTSNDYPLEAISDNNTYFVRQQIVYRRGCLAMILRSTVS